MLGALVQFIEDHGGMRPLENPREQDNQVYQTLRMALGELRELEEEMHILEHYRQVRCALTTCSIVLGILERFCKLKVSVPAHQGSPINDALAIITGNKRALVD